MADENQTLPEEEAAIETDVDLTEDETDLAGPASAALGRITVSPDLIDGLADMNEGDDLQLIIDANIAGRDEDGNMEIALNSGSLGQGSPGTEEEPADLISGGFAGAPETEVPAV